MGTTQDQNPDAVASEGNNNNKQPIEKQPFKWYITNLAASYRIIEARFGIFCILGGLIYIYHLLWTMAGVNAYTDYSRELSCEKPLDELDMTLFKSALSADNTVELAARQKNSEVFDTAIALVTIFHMIDWIRWLMLLVSALVSVNLLSIYYFLGIFNIPFGFIALIIGIAARYSEEGDKCATNSQQSRGLYLSLQIIVLILHLPLCLAHVLFLRLKGRDWCHEEYIKSEEEDE